MTERRIVDVYVDEGESWMKVGEIEVIEHPEGAQIQRAVIVNHIVSETVFELGRQAPRIEKKFHER